jgi:hypothetical protein
MNAIGTILRDAAGLRQTLGAAAAARWMLAIATKFPKVRKSGTLQPADRTMGDRPRLLRHRTGARARAAGINLVTGVREVWVRDAYLRDNWLVLPPGGTVVDLGGNRGLFTLLALASHPQNRCITVEADASFVRLIESNLKLNGWEDRCQLHAGVIGEPLGVLETASPKDLSPAIDQQEIADSISGRIDFLKVDIEGSEYGVLTPDSPLLQLADQVAMEVHDLQEPLEVLLRTLDDAGFEHRLIDQNPVNAILQARRR